MNGGEPTSEAGSLPALDLSRRVGRAPSTVAQDLLGECIVLNLDSGAYFSLGEVGGLIWERLESRQQLSAIVPHITARFAVDIATAEKDLLGFVGELLARRLVEVS